MGEIGDYHEQWVEVIHQQGKRDRMYFKSLTPYDKAFSTHSRWEEAHTTPEVHRINAVVKENRKGMFKSTTRTTTAATERQEKKVQQGERHKNLIANFQKRKFPSFRNILRDI